MRFGFLFTILLCSNSLLFSQVHTKKVYHPFTGTMTISVEGGATYGLTDYTGFSVDYSGRFMLEYYLPTYSKGTLGFRALGGAGFVKGKDNKQNPTEFRTSMQFVGGGLIYNLSLGEKIFPYFYAGASYMWFDPKDMNGNQLINNVNNVYKKNEINYNAEFGFRFLIAEDLTLNLNANAQISPNDYLDDKKYGSNDLFMGANLGFTFALFSEKDSDGDGVVDSKDACPDTPPGVKVDKFGCPIDTDGDGIPDFLDECPDTPTGVTVDRKGCPIDTDGDGVPDYLDICPNTPKGVQVDEFGCPLDSDNDGVPDYLDRCPNTPDGVKVDKFGCPLDSDGDGVPDYLDKCPNTPPGTVVDSYGCPVKKEEPPPKEVVLSAGASFGIGRANLLPTAYEELDKLVKAMKEEPQSRWLIEGHTDNTGSLNNNKKLSLKRAESVLNYFISKGIERSRFQVRGLGPDFPVADNRTEEGRAKNRRVKILRLD